MIMTGHSLFARIPLHNGFAWDFQGFQNLEKSRAADVMCEDSASAIALPFCESKESDKV